MRASFTQTGTSWPFFFCFSRGPQTACILIHISSIYSVKLLAGPYIMSHLCDHVHETNKTDAHKTTPYHQLRS